MAAKQTLKHKKKKNKKKEREGQRERGRKGGEADKGYNQKEGKKI